VTITRTAFLELVVRELIERREIGKLTIVEAVAPCAKYSSRFELHRSRERDNGEGFRRAFGWLKLSFTKPVQGPLCLGYACHFGLGQFIPAGDKEGIML
jgi:CRISPR-associated protein Csb2